VKVEHDDAAAAAASLAETAEVLGLNRVDA